MKKILAGLLAVVLTVMLWCPALVASAESHDEMVGVDDHYELDLEREADIPTDGEVGMDVENSIIPPLEEVEEEPEVQDSIEDAPEMEAEPIAVDGLRLAVTSQNLQNGTFRVTATGLAVPRGATVLMPTWSQSDQSDIVWYEASRAADGSFSINVNIARHRYHIGTYRSHLYLRHGNGRLEFIRGISHRVAFRNTGITVTNVDGREETFRVSINGLATQGMREIRFAVWGAVNGQNDLRWYTATRNGDNFIVNIPIRNHRELGRYYVHIWGVSGSGVQRFVGGTRFYVNGRGTGTMTITEVNRTAGTFRVNVRVNDAPSGVREVRIPIWSRDNQSDIHWYTATRQNDGTFTVVAHIRNHNFNFGQFQVHAWATMNNGISAFVAGRTVRLERDVSFSVSNANNHAGTFRLEATGLAALGSNLTVYMATWSQANQSDLVWHRATRAANGNFFADVNISRHRHNVGTYQSHLWVRHGNGRMEFVRGVTHRVAFRNTGITATDVNGREETFRVTVNGLTSQGMREVRFAVWGAADGQNDLRWYTATRNGNNFTVNIPIRNHRELGRYHVHIWGVSHSNTRHFVGGTTFYVNSRAAGTVAISNINQQAGTFRGTVNVTQALSGVSQVRVAVWSAANQNDMHWYTATRQSDGTFAFNGNLRNHRFNSGRFHAHAFVTMNNGVSTFIAGTTAQINLSNFIFQEDIGGGRFRVTIVNPANNPTEVLFPTWSDRNGQNDIVWYAGTRSGNRWSAIIEGSRHRHYGLFHTHVHGRVGGSLVFLGGITFNVPASAVLNPATRRVQNGVNSVQNVVGRDLMANYWWVVNNITWSRLPIHVTPPAGFTRSQWYAVLGFENRTGNCFVFAATFYQLARASGYNARYVEGTVGARGGGRLPHGWVEIQIGGAWYIFDPEAQRSIGGHNFFRQPINRPLLSYGR
ncbi:MAG: GBS Bsp-like repeat-containing protein [Lachnospiraceae bacterium]|nr:GBS Bsp-like repeat-containing protein [Lachnospiraceae bacterium]